MLRNHQTHVFRVINNKSRALAGCHHNDSVTTDIVTFWWSMLAADENIISQETRLVRLSMLRLASLQLVTLYPAYDPWSHHAWIRSNTLDLFMAYKSVFLLFHSNIFTCNISSAKADLHGSCQDNGLLSDGTKPLDKPMFMYHLWGHVASTCDMTGARF